MSQRPNPTKGLSREMARIWLLPEGYRTVQAWVTADGLIGCVELRCRSAYDHAHCTRWFGFTLNTGARITQGCPTLTEAVKDATEVLTLLDRRRRNVLV